ncbi:hypothetical protein [Tessaracoccus coleopterorum]|uniref:hypothetical protein n=1 Tax=Tessaracoccus coleopterorum TaxID=2714950 RepID=UPI0018D3260E|nr:hypothetical protein [Tessaracoccus coleopterorum]
MTHDNVAVTALTLSNPGASDVTLTLRAESPIAKAEADASDELVGTTKLRSGSNNGLVDTPWSDVTIRLKATGFAAADGALVREVTVPAAAASTSPSPACSTPTTCPTPRRLRRVRGEGPDEAVRDGITAFNEQWAADIPTSTCRTRPSRRPSSTAGGASATTCSTPTSRATCTSSRPPSRASTCTRTRLSSRSPCTSRTPSGSATRISHTARC